ncbi:MAG TPA: cobalamin-binding protein [Ktedonobacterales bacterium]|jgi:iron complex transport system substrate-binding protein|nr:cobalamin-binding protein [Ktedonobacterales bacterium]
MRDIHIVSLLPSATEILFNLGLGEQVVAVTHECDYPDAARTKPRITRSLLRQDLSSSEIDTAVSSQIGSDAHSLYSIDRTLLAELAPELIVTQQLCEVCAVGYGEVLDAIQALPKTPQVLNLEPMSLGEVLADIETVGAATGRQAEARTFVASLKARIARVRAAVGRAETHPTVAFLEWVDPLFRGGHWNPELVRLAGGNDPLGNEGTPSTRMEWQEVLDARPDVMVISCCGFDEQRTREDLPILEALPGYADLPCARNGRVHLVDGSAYFSRPGPRLVDSLEILAGFVHPELFARTG